MSSPASKRSAKRKAGKSPVGQLKRQLKAAQEETGEARMAVLNMRQMYRNSEQEILTLRDRLQRAETLAAAVIYAMNKTEVVVTDAHMNALAEEFSAIDTLPAEGGMRVVLVPFEEDDEELSEVPADE